MSDTFGESMEEASIYNRNGGKSSNIVVHIVGEYFIRISWMIETLDPTTMRETYVRVSDVEPVGDPIFLPSRRRKSKRSLDNVADVILIS